MVEELLIKLASCLDRDHIPYMIIGGQAVLVYGTPRLTRDIDLTLGIDSDRYEVIRKICQENGLKILPDNPEQFANETKVLPAEDPNSQIRVDFVFSFSSYEKQALQKTTTVQIKDYAVKFASIEDVIIHKMLAQRAVDLEDVKNILLKNQKKIDFDYIEKWLEDFSKVDEFREALYKFKQLRT